ncbi:MAG: hypothetical protein RR214_06540, partial [Synergistaceae bacterium]
LIKELQGLGLDVEIKYSDGSFGELVLNEEEEDGGKGAKHVSFKPDSTVDDIDAVFTNIGNKTVNDSELFHESATEYSGIELHETDEESEAAFLSADDNNLFSDTEPKNGGQGDEY